MAGRNTAKKAPAPKRITSLADVEARMTAMLADEFLLNELASFTVVLEGQTDLRYVRRAAELARHEGEDLLAVPDQLSERGIAILLCTPGTPGDPLRGGTKQMVRLGRALQPYVFAVDMLRGVLFVLDHDDAGIDASEKLAEYGFVRGQHSITLDPREHPGACAKKQVVVEDLLSLGIQESFFEKGGATCGAHYDSGQLKRFTWSHISKGPLCDFVCEHGTIRDFEEVIQLLRRVRRSFGLA